MPSSFTEANESERRRGHVYGKEHHYVSNADLPGMYYGLGVGTYVSALRMIPHPGSHESHICPGASKRLPGFSLKPAAAGMLGKEETAQWIGRTLKRFCRFTGKPPGSPCGQVPRASCLPPSWVCCVPRHSTGGFRCFAGSQPPMWN